MSIAIVHLHQKRPPFAPINELASATDIDRVMPVDEPGKLTFRLASNEPQRYVMPTSPLDLAPPPNIREGDAIVVRSSEGVLPWLWLVDKLVDESESGMVTVECSEWRELLYRRQVPLSFVAGSRSVTSVAGQLLAAVNGRNPTHIRPGPQWLGGSRVVLPAEELALGGLSLGAAFDELALRSDTEWWLEYRVTWSSVEPLLYWAERRGLDLASLIRVDGMFHLTDATYSRDESEVAETSQFIGGGQTMPTAPAGGIVVGSAIARAKPSIGGRVEPADAFSTRLALNRGGGPGASGERAESRPSEMSEQSLLQSGRRRQRVPITARQSLEMQLRGPWPGSPSSTSWSIERRVPTMQPGDTIEVALPQAAFGSGVHIIARVLAMQPDEATGIMGLVVEVQQGTVQFLRGMET